MMETNTQTREVAKGIYLKLDEFTGGIEPFLDRRANETFRDPPYMVFIIKVISDRKVMFGYLAEINGTLCPDPAMYVSLGNGEAELGSLVINTLQGYSQGADKGGAKYCLDFLERMVDRKASW